MNSTTSRPGIRSEVLAVLREWLTTADEIAYTHGGTYARVLAEALETLEQKEGDAPPEPSP